MSASNQKRKVEELGDVSDTDVADAKSGMDEDEETESDRDSDSGEDESIEQEIIDVDFDFFCPKQIDFLATKNLLKQLFSSDSELFNLSELTELIIGQPLLGTMVKIDDGPDSDPYAFLTVLNMNEHRSTPVMQSLYAYILEKSKKSPELHAKLSALLQETSSEHVGLLLSERLINMPVQIVPPMYKMLVEEIQWAVEDNEPYQFEWYLMVTKTYREVIPKTDEDDAAGEASTNNRSSSKQHRKKKKKTKSSELSIFYFHAEDEIIEQNADFALDFELVKQSSVPDSRRAFQDIGVAPAMKLFLIHKSKIGKLISELEVACK